MIGEELYDLHQIQILHNLVIYTIPILPAPQTAHSHNAAYQ